MIKKIIYTTLIVFLTIFISKKWTSLEPQPTQPPSIIQEAVPVAYVADIDVGIKLKPLTKIHYKTPFFDITNITNKDGYVDREHALEKKAYRIAILGDSSVEAYGVEPQLRFSAEMEREIYNRTQKKAEVEVMTFGVSGWGTAHEYGCIKNTILKYKPDEVWLFFLAINDMGDNTPLLNGPPTGPTFIYSDATESKLTDIKFGYVHTPDIQNDLRRKKYGDELLNSFAAKWTFGYFSYFFSEEKNPVWEMVSKHTFDSFQLISDLLRANKVRGRVVYRLSGYEYTDHDWNEFTEGSFKALGKKIPMDRNLGERRTAEKLKQMGLEMVSLREQQKAAILLPKDETDVSKHKEIGKFLADVILKTVPEKKLIIR